MTRLIDADALLEAFKEKSNTIYNKEWRLFDIEDLITNAPTVDREGWVSVPIEPTEEMLKAGVRAYKNNDVGMRAYYKAMIEAAPTDTE